MPAHESIIRSMAESFSVSSMIHPDDHIFNFIISHPGFPSDETRIRYYFADGRESVDKLNGILRRHFGSSCVSLLEFASGYGCVSRHIANEKQIDLFACDIHPQAIEFLNKEINVKAVQSSSIPEQLDVGRAYDAVFALSFFSHMPITTWSRWLVRLFHFVRPGGILIFTTQGLRSLGHLLMDAPTEEYGYRFALTSEQVDIPVEEYGQMVVTLDFVRKQIATVAGAEIVEDEVDTWWGHQDVFIVRKSRA